MDEAGEGAPSPAPHPNCQTQTSKAEVSTWLRTGTFYLALTATDALREDESHIFGKAVALAIGVGIGIGIGVLIAPASGDETRADIANKVSDLGEKVHEHSGKKPMSASGTHG